jgi:hypothetical protein
VRHVAFAVVVVAGLAGAVRADDRADDGFTDLPKYAAALTMFGHATHIGGMSESGFGGNLELAIGDGRLQYFGEGSVSSAGYQPWNQSALDTKVAGVMARAGVGIRWLARQFTIDHGGALELYLQTHAGTEKFWWHDHTSLSRPELGVGLGMQARAWAFHDLGFRIEMRAVFTPSSDQREMPTGFMTSIGFSI